MASAHIKKIIRIGGSLAIILPTDWARDNVKAGEEMVLVGNGELRVFPVHPKRAQLINGRELEGGKGK